MSEFKITSITNREGGHGPQVCGIVTFTGSGLTLPSGGLSGGRGRMVTYGGYGPGYNSEMNTIDIATLGSATDFGDGSRENGFSSGMASSTRAVFKQGRHPTASYGPFMEFTTFSSLGGVIDFGEDRGADQDSSASSADGIRGIFGNGTSYDAKIQSITLATTGDTTEFGTLASGRYMGGGAGGASPTRGFFFGGLLSGQPAGEKIIETVTFASGGVSTKFGELTVGRRAIAAVTNNTRAVACSGGSPNTNTMDYITMTTEGNAIDFGDINNQNEGYGAGGSTTIRGVIVGCKESNGNAIDFITLSTTGNATDFGDTTYKSYICGACSDLHGGLTQ